MDPNFSKEAKEKRDDYFQNPGGYMYTNETLTSKDIKKKRVRYKKGPGGSDFPLNSAFQIPEKDRNRYLALENENFANSSKFGGKHLDKPEKLRDSSRLRSRSRDPSLQHDQDVNYLGRGQQYERHERLDDLRKLRTPSVERERVTNQVNYFPPSNYNNYQETSNVTSDKIGSDINKNSSLICRAVNMGGEPVTLNDEVVKDKLILTCRPKSYYGPGGYLKKATEVDSGRIQKNVYPPRVSVIENINVQQNTDKRIIENNYDERRQSTLVRSNAYDSGSLGLGDQGMQKEVKPEEKYEEQYRIMQCNRYRRTFRNFLWALFIINLILLWVGITLLLLTLVHVLFYPYINSVIGHIGYASWVWGALALSLLIILVAVYGMTTALTRVRRMLMIYCILALALAIIILIFLLIFWVMAGNTRNITESGMKHTFHLYRCNRLVRVAWDNLHESFQCCGIEGRGDWKYIPPSCCHAENKYQKVKCIGHFIQEDQANKASCRSMIEDYFTTMFLLITCLLVFAIILLLLGILVALRLYKMYKIIRLCQDMYFITP